MNDETDASAGQPLGDPGRLGDLRSTGDPGRLGDARSLEDPRWLADPGPLGDPGRLGDPGSLEDAGRRRWAEVGIVLGLSLGQSAVYAILRLIDRLTRPQALGDQSVQMHAPASTRPWLDLIYQVAGIAFALVSVFLALHLLARPGGRAGRLIGFDTRRPGRDLAWGVGLAAGIGLPGIGLYVVGRMQGITVHIQTSALNQYWWTIPILVASAVQNAILEEVVAVGYLSTRLEQMGWKPVAIVAASALLRGSYHLYQGWGQGLGNVVMGVVFVIFYRRTGRVMPLVAAHTILDVVSFIGPTYLPEGLLP